MGIERGEVVQASRQTPSGLLRWHITVLPDGQRLFDGCLPTLIQWGEVHPTDAMPPSGVHLQNLQVKHPHAQNWPLVTQASVPRLRAVLQTPLGLVELCR